MGFLVSASRSYLYQTPSGYIFRLKVPRDLRPLVGQGEFRYSLRAGALHYEWRSIGHGALHRSFTNSFTGHERV